MKRVTVLLLVVTMLVACGNKSKAVNENVYENISESIALDTEQVIEIIDSTITEKRELNDKEKETLDYYNEVYSKKIDDNDPNMTQEDIKLFTITKKITRDPEYYQKSASNEKYFYDQVEQINSIIKTGDYDY